MVKLYTGKIMKKLLLPIMILVLSASFGQEMKTVVTKLTKVNSTSDELMPVFSYDGKTMYYVRGSHPENDGGTHGGQDIWYSELQEDSSWGAPERFEQPLNNVQDNSVCGISPDGNTLYLDNIYDSKKKMHPGLSKSVKQPNGKWGKPETVNVNEFIPKPPFLEYSFPESNHNVLLISAENEDTSRKEDLYVSIKGENGEWKKPIHMGDVINSAGYEIAPFLARDGKTLYFASNGFGGEGSCDMFKSTRLDNTWTNWSKPENLGPELNTTGFDAYYTIDAFGRAYFASGSLEDGDDDIYMVTYEKIEPEVVAVIEPEPEPEPEPVVVPDPEPFVPKYDEKFSVYFDLDKSDIKSKYKKTVQDVLVALNKDDSRMVTVVGHTCDRGSKEYNQKLSEKRSNAVVSYLLANGVSEDRIKYFAEGMFKPKVENSTEENREQNRRAEIHVYE
jgi:outer membrane protein OmpA-like peptidoglycan-associated protein